MKQQQIYTLRTDRSEEGSSLKILRSQLVVESTALGYYEVEDVGEGGGGRRSVFWPRKCPTL